MVNRRHLSPFISEMHSHTFPLKFLGPSFFKALSPGNWQIKPLSWLAGPSTLFHWLLDKHDLAAFPTKKRLAEWLNLTKSISSPSYSILFCLPHPLSFIFLLIPQYGASFCFWLFSYNLIICLLIKSCPSSATSSWILWMSFRSS